MSAEVSAAYLLSVAKTAVSKVRRGSTETWERRKQGLGGTGAGTLSMGLALALHASIDAHRRQGS